MTDEEELAEAILADDPELTAALLRRWLTNIFKEAVHGTSTANHPSRAAHRPEGAPGCAEDQEPQ